MGRRPGLSALLQEYFGYVLSGRLDMQKMLLLVGPIRGGKGTIARMLTALMGGRRNVPGPTLAAMNTNFGLSPLIGKPLAIVSDARLGNMPSHTVVERLLSITGEDTLTMTASTAAVDRELPTRFVLLTNELPVRDSSGDRHRMLILRMTERLLNRGPRVGGKLRRAAGDPDGRWRAGPAQRQWSLRTAAVVGGHGNLMADWRRGLGVRP
jgi:putative DNA primase/helicase